jgi:antitoxin (DNA-binding transcriptional repressor) of toxin-antitoxin stability system
VFSDARRIERYINVARVVDRVVAGEPIVIDL